MFLEHVIHRRLYLPTPPGGLLLSLLHHLRDGVLELEPVTLVLDNKGTGLLTVHQHGAKVDVINWEDLISAKLNVSFYRRVNPLYEIDLIDLIDEYYMADTLTKHCWVLYFPVILYSGLPFLVNPS